MNVPRNSTTRGRRATVSVSAAVVSASLLLGACGVSNKSDTESVSARSAGTESPERERSNTTVAPTTEATTATAPEGASSGATMLKDAIRATAEATSFQAKASLALNGLPDGDATILSVDGGYDTQAKRGQFLIEVGQLPAMSGTVAEIPTPSGPVEVVVDGSTVYVRADELAALNNGKPWTSIDLSDLGGLAGATPPPAGADIPDQVLGALEGAFGNVETVGREDVDGASTTHLRVALDLNAIVEEMLSGHDASELGLIVPHQVNKRIIDAAVQRLDIPPEKVLVNIERMGNTSAASVPLALDEARRTGRLEPGKLVVLAAFGAGLTWGGALLRW